MGNFQADTLRDSIVAGWALTGTMAKAGSAASGVYPVYILAHTQTKIEEIATRKAVEVRKLTPLENIITHPRFQVINDVFEIACYYELPDSDETIWDNAEADIEDICEEVVRIVKTVYDPSAGTGEFFTTNREWRNLDDLRRAGDPILKRVLLLTLSRIQSDSTEVFTGGFGGVLSLDISATTADSKPGADHIYTEAYNVITSQGYEVIPELVRGGTATSGVPDYFSGGFSGEFTCEMYATKDDTNSSTIESVDNIYKLQTDGELAEITFLHAVDNTEGTPVTFTESIPLLITKISKTAEDKELVVFTLEATIQEPTTYTVA